MKREQSDWAYLNDRSGRYWYHLKDGNRIAVDSSDNPRAPQRAIYAIPTNDLVSHPHWISSKDEEIISEVVAVENEKLGVKPELGPGRIADWRTVETNGSRTLVQSVAIPWNFEGLADGPTEFVDFLPQYSLYPPPENAVVIWRENNGWVVGYSRGGQWAHVQPLGNVDVSSLAGEIELTLMELSAKEIIEKHERTIVWEPDETELIESLTSSSDVPVAYRPRPSPAAPGDWDLEPHEITQRKIEKAKQRRGIWIGILACFFVMLLVAAAFIHIRLLESENRNLEKKIAANREDADRIELAQEQWYTLSPAVDPQRNPIELFHRVSTLLPEKGFRLTEFQHQGYRTLLIGGEGASMANALQIKGALEKAENLTDYEWEIGPPRTKNDLIEFDASGVYKFATQTDQ